MTRPLRSTDPDHIGDYVLIGRIGGGGMGDVFLGRSPGGRLVAVKVVRDLLADDARFRARFRREVDAARRVGGAYTAAVLDADPDAERPWLATAFIDGPSLADKVEDAGPLPAGEVRRMGAGLAEALREMHRAGLVHRDLKPGNVLLAEDGPRLIDFGIIRAEDGAGLTETGFVLGSAGYMAPEQASGNEATSAADVYALGAVLTFAATGKGPFGDGAAPAVLLRQAGSPPDIAGVPEGLRGVVARCLEQDPGARPTTDELLMLLGGAMLPMEDMLQSEEPPKHVSVLDTHPVKKPAAKVKKADRPPKPKKARTKPATTATPRMDADTMAVLDAVIASTETTRMPLEKSKAKSKSNQRQQRQHPRANPTPHPTRRKLLIFGALGAAGLGVAAGIANMPGGDTKPTGGEIGTDTGADTDTVLPTVQTPGLIGGPLKPQQWSQTLPDSVQVLTATDGTVLAGGSLLTAIDGATGTPHWSAPRSELDRSDIWQSGLPVVGDTVYNQTIKSELVALSAKNGTQSWSAPSPPTWYPGGVVGASPDLVVLWSASTDGVTNHRGLWAADPRHEGPTWSTTVPTFDGLPYYNQDAGLVVISCPQTSQLLAYRTDDGKAAWTAADTAGRQDAAFATSVTGYGKNTYWATNRLYAFDENGKPLWPIGVTDSGENGMFHAVAADADTVYAAVNVVFGSDVIVAYKASDGAPVWRAAWPEQFHTPSLECEMALGGGNLYVVDRFSRTLVALDAATGRTLWQYHDPKPAAKSDGDVYWHVAADDTHAYIAYGSTVRAFTAK